MQKPIIILISIAALILVLAVIGRSPDFTIEQLTKLVAQSEEMSRFALSPNPDFNLLEKNYKNGPRKIVKWVDAKMDIEMDDKIRDSIKLGAKGSIPKINSLIIELTIKRVFLEYIRYQMKNQDSSAKIETVVKALDQYVVDGEKWAGKTGELSAAINKLSKNLDSDSNANQLFEIIRTGLILNFLAELDQIERLRKSNYEEALYHSAKAMQFLHMIYQDISVINRADAVFIYGEFAKNPKIMDIRSIRDKMKTGFGKISRDLQNILETSVNVMK